MKANDITILNSLQSITFPDSFMRAVGNQKIDLN